MKKWQKAEIKSMEKLGAHHHTDSGRMWWSHGDGHDTYFM